MAGQINVILILAPKKFKIPAKSGCDLRRRPTFEQKNTKVGFLYFCRYRGEKGARGDNEVQEVELWTKGMKDLSSLLVAGLFSSSRL